MVKDFSARLSCSAFAAEGFWRSSSGQLCPCPLVGSGGGEGRLWFQAQLEVRAFSAHALTAWLAVLVCCFSFDPFLNMFFCAIQGKDPASFFYMWTASFPVTICWQDHLCLIEWSWHLCQKSFDHTCEGLFLGSPFCSIVLCPYAVTTSLNDCSVVRSKSGSAGTPALFFFKVVLAFHDPLQFHINLGIGFSISAKIKLKKRLLEFQQGLWQICSADCCGWYCHFNVTSSHPWTRDVFPIF